MKMFLLVSKLMYAAAALGFIGIFVHFYNVLVLEPEKLREKLRKQGIKGPPPTFLIGNVREIMKKTEIIDSEKTQDSENMITHNCSSIVCPYFDQWQLLYGPVHMFSLGNMQVLYMNDPDVVKEMSTCTSLNFGKPSYQQNQLGPLMGQGILTSNGSIWAHQRKILSPEFHMDKVKGMMNLMVDSSMALVNSWNERIESEGGVADMTIDSDMRTVSGDVISRACFCNNYSEGKEIFSKLNILQDEMSKKFMSSTIPGMRYLPTKSNRKIWRLEKDIRTRILKIVEQRKDDATEDFLQMILEGAESINLDQVEMERFIVDNCKNIYLAGYESSAVSAMWTLMLLASNPEWQERIRTEVSEVCGDQLPDADMVRKMKMLTMVIHESLRLYPPGAIIAREALQDMKLGGIDIPKGVNIWILTAKLHQDPEIWGPDSEKFKPERFINGVGGACKLPHIYIPFGVGPRMCIGQNFALAELKILLAVLISKFSFSLSPNYRHSPTLRLVVEPKHGMNLLVRKV